MAHELTIREDGTVEAAYALTAAWHGLGTVIDHAMTSEEAMAESHLDWTVLQCPLRGLDMTTEPPVSFPVDGYVATVRDDNKAILGVVGTGYQIVQNAEAFAFLDNLVPDGIVKYESAGSLFGGKKVWVLARMPETFEVAKGDRLEQYILMQTSHDGSRAVTIMPTSVRVVCNNTLNLAIAHRGRRLELTAGTGAAEVAKAKRMVLKSIRHTKNVKENIEQALGMVQSAQAMFDEFHSRAERLAKATFDFQKLEALTFILIPVEKGINDSRRQKARDGIMAAFHDDPQNLASIRGTAWAAFNAVSQWVDHQSSYSGKQQSDRDEHRMISITEGANAQLKAEALNLVEAAVVAAE